MGFKAVRTVDLVLTLETFNLLLSDGWLGVDSRGFVFYIQMVVKSVCTCRDLGFDIFRDLRTYFGKEFWQSRS